MRVNVILTNQLGQTIKEMKSKNKMITIDIEDLPSGTYIVKISNNETTLHSEKIVKK